MGCQYYFRTARWLLIIWLLQQAPISSVEGVPTSVSQDASPVSVRLCHRGGLPEVSGGLSLARWVHLPSMRARKILRIGEPTAKRLGKRWSGHPLHYLLGLAEATR